MNRIFQFLFTFFFCFCIMVMILVCLSIIEEWIVFNSYGWIWNEYTTTSIVLWDILLGNILAIFVVSMCITLIVFFIVKKYSKKEILNKLQINL